MVRFKESTKNRDDLKAKLFQSFPRLRNILRKMESKPVFIKGDLFGGG
jgi:hypothetical protein